MSSMSALTATVAPARTSPTYNEGSFTVIKNHTNVAKKSYRKPDPNAAALTRMTAWLQAAAIPVKQSSTSGCDLVLTDANGRDIEIKVGISYDDARPAVEHLFVLACEVTSRHSATALRAFQSITVATGYGAAKPIDRGEEPAKKLNYEDNFELVAMRHKEFRRVPNPTAAELAKYDRVINKAVSRFMYINAKICKRHNQDFGDLKTYAQIWTCNYLGLYKVANPTNNDNEKKLYAHLCQRFHNYVDLLLKKERNCVVDSNTVSIALYGRPYDANIGSRRIAEGYEQPDSGSWEEPSEAEQIDEVLEFATQAAELDFATALMPVSALDETDDEAEKEQISEAKRRKQAQAALKAAFAKLPHDRMVELLKEASENEHLCYDARMEARKQLRLHAKECDHCTPIPEELEAEAGE
jgi:hypothetical protein